MALNVLFNHLIQSYLLVSLNNLNVLNYLNSLKTTSLQEMINDLNLVEEPVKALLHTAQIYGLIENDNESKYSLTPFGKDAYQQIGFFTWAIGGYGNFLASLDKLCKGDREHSLGLIKGEFVAKGSDECYQHLMREILNQAISTIPFSYVADLGCGNAGKLIEFAQKDPEFRGIGVDINQDAIELAQKKVKGFQLESQIQLFCGNALNTLNSELCFPEVETVMCFMMFHDLFNIPDLSFKLFDKLKKTFPNVRYFVIGDTVLSNSSVGSNDLPIFTIGFELIHQFMNVKLFDLQYYLDVFKAANLKIEQTLPFGVPNTYLFILKV